MIDGILNGIFGSTNATELDIVDLTDNELVEVLDGLGRYRGRPNFSKRVSRFVHSLSRKNKRNIVRLRPSDSKSMTGKSLFEKRISLIESADIRRDLASGKLTIADFAVYSIKKADTRVVEMFESSDNRAEGKTNINAAKLGNDTVMLVTKIVFQEGVVANAGDEGYTAKFGLISPVTASGEFTFKNGQKLFAERSGMGIFTCVNDSNGIKGEFELESPKMLQDDKEIIFETKLPDTPPANTFYKITLKGVATVRA